MLKGRYGADKLGFVMVIASIAITLIASLLNSKNILMRIILLVISAGLLGYAVFRIFSKNMKARKRELHVLEKAEYKFAMLFSQKHGEKSETNADKSFDNKNQSETKQTAENTDNTNADEKEEKNINEKPLSDEYKHFRCPKCRKPLKVPKGKGYIKVACPACNHKFTKHT